MTDNEDTNQEPENYVNPAMTPGALDDEGDDEFADEGAEAVEGELTPNDIFGLDPLDVLTLEELADYLKVSPAAARRVMKEQNLPGRNIGGEWRFLRDAVANWLRGQEAPAAAQQAARTDYSKAKEVPAAPAQGASQGEQYSRPPRRPFQAEQSGGGGDYRPPQRFPEGGQQFGQQGGGQYGNRSGGYRGGAAGGGGGGQYGGGGGQYGSSGGQYSGGGSYGGGQSEGGGDNAGGSYTRPPRRPFRAEGSGSGGGGGGGGGNYSGGGGTPGYSAGGAAGGQFGGGGYAGGGQRFGGGPKRKNKRQVFENERGKRLDRRKEDGPPDGQE